MMDMPRKASIDHVPRYYTPYVKDCFFNGYGAVLSYLGLNPDIVLAEYLTFMFEEETGYIGTTFLNKYHSRVKFTSEELNSSLEFAQMHGSDYYDDQVKSDIVKPKDKIYVHWYIHDDPVVASARTKELIDANIPVIAGVDMYYMKYHKYFGQNNQLHAVVITGYDDDDQSFELFDNYKMGMCDYDGRLSYEELQTGRCSEIPSTNPIQGDHIRPIRNLWIEISVDPDFRITDEKIYSILDESCKRMIGEKIVLGEKCGLDKIKEFKEYLLGFKNHELDKKTIFFFKEYYLLHFKGISRSRYRFKVFIDEIADKLPQDLAVMISSDLEQSSKHWQIASTMALKFSISKRMNLIDDLAKQLTTIVELETRITDHMKKCLHSYK